MSVIRQRAAALRCRPSSTRSSGTRLPARAQASRIAVSTPARATALSGSARATARPTSSQPASARRRARAPPRRSPPAARADLRAVTGGSAAASPRPVARRPLRRPATVARTSTARVVSMRPVAIDERLAQRNRQRLGQHDTMVTRRSRRPAPEPSLPFVLDPLDVAAVALGGAAAALERQRGRVLQLKRQRLARLLAGRRLFVQGGRHRRRARAPRPARAPPRGARRAGGAR